MALASEHLQQPSLCTHRDLSLQPRLRPTLGHHLGRDRPLRPLLACPQRRAHLHRQHSRGLLLCRLCGRQGHRHDGRDDRRRPALLHVRRFSGTALAATRQAAGHRKVQGALRRRMGRYAPAPLPQDVGAWPHQGRGDARGYECLRTQVEGRARQGAPVGQHGGACRHD